jgi:hypothetical protein
VARLRKEEQAILIRVEASRKGEASYNYRLSLTPQEVLRCLFMLPAEAIPGAVRALRKEYVFTNDVPEILKQLALGLEEPEAGAQDEDGEGPTSLFG